MGERGFGCNTINGDTARPQYDGRWDVRWKMKRKKMHIRLQNDVSMQLSGYSPHPAVFIFHTRGRLKGKEWQRPVLCSPLSSVYSCAWKKAQFCHEKRILHWPVKLRKKPEFVSYLEHSRKFGDRPKFFGRRMEIFGHIGDRIGRHFEPCDFLAERWGELDLNLSQEVAGSFPLPAVLTSYLKVRRLFIRRENSNGFSLLNLSTSYRYSTDRTISTRASGSGDGQTLPMLRLELKSEGSSHPYPMFIIPQVRELVFNLHMILTDTVKMKEYSEVCARLCLPESGPYHQLSQGSNWEKKS